VRPQTEQEIFGYHTDKTLIYAFGGAPSGEALAMHEPCVQVERRAAVMLRPGAIPSEIYSGILDSLDAEFRKHFMGYGERHSSFLGHGIGLQIDEPPVIAKSFAAEAPPHERAGWRGRAER
jgi:Xaa-Pro aminopeptidase